MLSALKIPGYEITEVIHEGLNTIVYRGVSQPKSEKVILKVLKAEYPSLEEITRLKHEYSITQNLDIEGIVKVARLEQARHHVLVSEDFGGISLHSFLALEKLSLVSFLSIAVQLAKCLISLHTHQIIHKDIKPSNIIINPQSGIVKLTDFSIASRLSQEAQLISLSNLEGTLAYISPEQTGRMNRAVDYRTDFYSLGVTFYEMLTGQLPFQSDDALEMVHCHIAKQPPCILDFNAKVPRGIAAIITKLMAKNAEDRYQSGAGLLADLERCLDELKNTGKITEFLPGESDRISQLNIPQKLYGREKEVETLLAGFDAISQGESQLMLVAGYSGIGKSSLVNEVHKPIVRQRGYFISGKFDQFQRAVPYASLIHAFQSLMRQLLVENATQLKSWKEKLSRALGNNGQVIIDVIPELELIIGVQPPVVELSAMERQNRFNQVFQEFVGVFTQKEHPLVIFLDDLQWADIASLNLMQRLMTDSNTQYLLLIAAYRDNEVSPTHPFIQTVEEIQKTDTTVNRITLENLNISQVQQLVNETFNITDNSIAQDLASLLFNKTLGNPFFITQLLKTLYQEKLIKYDFTLKCWEWNLQQIQRVGITNLDIVKLMASNISKLPAYTQSALQLAACIGGFFKLDILATVSGKSASDIIKSLWPALQQGLILSHNYQAPPEQLLLICDESLQKFSCDEIKLEFRFLHDRVQQAAYSLIPEGKKQATHLKIGKLLLNYFSSSELDDHILDIVNQLNTGAKLLDSQVEKEELAKLNLLASRKAKTANAPTASAQYLNIGMQLLPDSSWQTHYDLTLNLYVELIEAEYLNTNFENLQQLCEVVLINAKNILDAIKVYELKIRSCNSQFQAQAAIEIGLYVLNKLGVRLAEQLPKDIIVKQLENLPQIQDTYQIAALKILNTITYATYQTAPDLYLKVIFTMVDICIRYGNCEIAAYAYASCSLVCEVIGEIGLGYEYGLLSLKILDKFNAIPFAAKVITTYNGCVRHWKEHGKLTLNAFLEAFNTGVETGDIEYASIASIYFCIYSFLIGEPLSLVDDKYRKYLDFTLSVKQEFLIRAIQIWRQLALNLQSLNQNSCRLIGDSFNEDEFLPILIETNQVSLLFGVYFAKSMLAYLFQQYDQAIEYSQLSEKYAAASSATMMIVHHNFYYSLALLKHYPKVPRQEQEQYLAQVIANQNQMKIWSFYCTANNQHKYDLVEAEKCRILGQYWEATQLYNSAIELASENGYIQEEAIASELAGEFYLASGNTKVAKTYLTDAYYAYQQWGATAKVKDLESRYPYLTLRKRESTSQTTTLTTSSKTCNNYSSLDSTTIIKASHTLSSEIVLSSLLAKLMHLLRENAGAQKVCFIAKHDKQLFLEAVLTQELNEVQVLQSLPIYECNILPLSLIDYVQRTLTPLVLDNATQSENFSTDTYIEANQALSILVFPVIHLHQLRGILYLENNLTKAAFTQDRVELLSVLAAQAAISLENARFYTTLENRVAERTQELAERNQELQATLEKLHQTQIKLIQSEKMSSLGQLVAGVAHEINNPINFIYGNLTHTHQYTQSLFGLLKLYQENYPNPVYEIINTTEEIDLDFIQYDLPKIFSSMKNGAGRIKSIVLSLRNFARLDEAESKRVNIHEGLDNTLIMLQQKLGAIQIIKEYANLPEVYCFAGELNQVFMNLLNNAIEAVATKPENAPTIWIRTAVKEHNQIAITIADNGAGIKPEIQSKIFDPFFTTKPVGHGTGLGLSISHQIVQQHKGQLLCLSELGVGTEFTILLPY